MKIFFSNIPFIACFYVSVMITSPVIAAEPSANWHQLFPNVPTISLNDIEQRIDELVLVDVRPKFEFERQHRTGVMHMSFSSRMFMIQMEELINNNKNKTIVVYCETGNCIKAYRAVEKCRKENFSNVVLFDINKDMAESGRNKIYSQL